MTVLATSVSHYRTWVLTVSCPNCRDKQALRIEPLMHEGRGGESIADFIPRLTCGVCRSSPRLVRLQSRPDLVPKGSPPIREIILIGPGAY